jgi:hypothetical protein
MKTTFGIIGLIFTVLAASGQVLLYDAVIQGASFSTGGTNAGGGSGGCTQEKENTIGLTTAAEFNLGYSAGETSIAFSFWASNTYSMCSCAVSGYSVGSPAAGIRMVVCNDASGTIGATNGTPSDEFNTSLLSSSEAPFLLTGLTASITNNTRYWMVFYRSSGAWTSYVNYMKVTYAGGSDSDLRALYDGSSWGAPGTYGRIKSTGYSR